MTAGWFHRRPSGALRSSDMKEAAQVLQPPRNRSPYKTNKRFNSLLLEYGEEHIQDWAVIVYSSPSSSFSSSPNNNNDDNHSTLNKHHHYQVQTTWAQQQSLTSTDKKKKKKKKKQYDKDSYPSVYMTNLEGRLHLCSKSIVLEPTDPSRAIVRIPLLKLAENPKLFPKEDDFDPMCLEFISSKHFTINNKISPFSHVNCNTKFRFTFLHSDPQPCLQLCTELMSILKKGTKQDLEQLLQNPNQQVFDFHNLFDMHEKTTCQVLKAQKLEPLTSQRGSLVITQQRLYFQPAAGALDKANENQATVFNMADIKAYARRYHGLRDCALELFWNNDQTSTLLALERTHERELVVRLLPKDILCHTDREFLLKANQAWQTSQISNYEYLLLLNSASGRTFQDLSRYPVFPWIIADYTSEKLDLTNPKTFRDLTKPVGALNDERLEYFQLRFESMQDMEKDPFLYGTHYSAAGYVLYYLVRSMPEHMLCLQNGKFDAPDRMFHSLDRCFKCCLSNHADVKELIPEFYCPEARDFLINAKSLQLGATQLGDRVNDVTLPKWAKSPRDFLKKNVKALESDYCTSMLPRWIDLIFGSKSRGEAAKEANNIFHSSSYMGPDDLASLATVEERFQAELQATEFGIVPDQLFIALHPLKHETVDESFVKPDIGRASFSGTEQEKGEGAWELLDSPKLEEPNPFSIDPTFAASAVLSQKSDDFDPEESRDQHHPFNNMLANNQSPQQRGGGRRNQGLALSGTGDASGGSNTGFGGIQPALSNVSSYSAVGPLSPTSPAATNVSTEWDIKFIEKTRIHADTISGCAFILDERFILATTSLDGGLKVHQIELGLKETEDVSAKSQGITSTLSRFSYITMARGGSSAGSANQSKLTEFRSHTSRDPLACLALASDGHGGKIAFAGGHDDVVFAYGITSGCAVASVYSHRDAVTGLDLLIRPPTLADSSKLWLEKSTHIMVSGSWDATVKVWSVTVSNGETVSIDREPLAELFDADSSIVCVSAANVPNDGGVVIGAGCADGSFCVWNLHSDGVKVVIHKEQAKRGSGPCSVVKWSTSNGRLHLFTGLATGKVASFALSSGAMRKISAASVGVAIQCLAHQSNILLVGCADGGLRLIPTKHGAQFTSDLSLWPSVNNKSSPGLSSVGMSFIEDGSDGKCICCTGAEDGSVALFELKRAQR